MKRFFSTLVAAVLTAALLIPGALADGAGGVTYDLSVNESHDVTVSSGETVTVIFAVTGEETVSVSTLQNEIYYDTAFFELVSGEPGDGSGAVVSDQQRVNGDHVVQVAFWGSKTITDRTEFAVIRLKVIASSGSSTVVSKARNLAPGTVSGVGAGVEAYAEDGSPISVALQPVTVTVGGSPISPTPPMSPSADTAYAVTVADSDHGSVLCDPSARAGSTVTITPQPDLFYAADSVTVTDDSGKSVAVKDNGDGTYSFVMPDGAVTVQVSFAHTYCPSEPYVDVIKSEWYHPAVDYVIEHKYFIGTSDTTFEPNTVMSRAMFATVIARMAGFDETKYTTSEFDDVADGAWYTAAIAWAAENGIVLGYGDGNFGPDDLITREQMAAMLYRYTNYKQAALPQTGVSLDTFPDSAEVSGWAREAMEWATLSDLLHGTDEGLLEPLRGAKRAEMAQLLMNYDLALQ